MGNLRVGWMADVCKRSMVNEPWFLPYLSPENVVSHRLTLNNPRKSKALTPIVPHWDPKAFIAERVNIVPARTPNNPTGLPTVTPSNPKTSGGDGRAYFVIHSDWWNLLLAVAVQYTSGRRYNPTDCPKNARLVQIRGPVEPSLIPPAFELALLSWLRAPKAEETKIAIVEPQTINSILGASEKWSIIPATYILVGVCSMRLLGGGTGI